MSSRLAPALTLWGGWRGGGAGGAGGGGRGLEEGVVVEAAGGIEGGAQVVEQVGDEGEDGGLATGHEGVGDGDGQVGLATAVGAAQDEPPLGPLGVVLRHANDAMEVVAFL